MASTTAPVLARRALVVASSPLARAGLTAILRGQGIDVIGQVADDHDLSDDLDIFRPDVIIWDLGYEPALSYERLSDLRPSRVPVIVLMAATSEAADCTPALLAHGARAVLLHSADASALAAAIEAVLNGLITLDRTAVEALMPAALTPSDGRQTADALTPREIEVLRLIAEGLPNKQIALRLLISEHTVKFHVNSILTKLGAQSRTEAVVRATRLGWIAL